MNTVEAKKILIIEDDAIIALAESQVLQDHGYEVIIAISCQKALDAIQTDPRIDIVLMDIDLGRDTDGTEAARQILTMRNIPIVFLTSHSEREMVEKVRGITRYGYVLKDSGDFVLISSIEMAFELFEAHERNEMHKLELKERLVELELKSEELQRTDQERERYLDLYDLAPVGYFSMNGEGLVTKANHTAAAMLGREKEEVTGQALLRFIAVEDGQVYSAHLEHLARTGTPQMCEVRMNRKDGSHLWVSMHATAALFELQTITSFRIAIIDITQRRQAEEKLRESEETFRAHVENSFDVIFTLDREGTFIFVSPAWERHFGYPTTEVTGKSFVPFVHPDDATPLIVYLKRVLDTRQSETSPPYRVRHANGGWVWFIANSTPYVNAKGEIIFVGVGHDITLRRQAEEEINTLLQEKELILREVHHHIKNTMHTMMGLLLQQSKTIDDPKAVSALRDAGSRLQSMGALYDRLYRSEGFREISIKEYFPPLIEEIAGMYPGREKVKIETDIADFALGRKILSPLGIIVNELITNAMKYAFIGRDSGLIKASVSLAGRRATLIFEDNGNGLPESVDIEKSKGFGLRLVSQLARQLKGSIRLERQGGTRFILEFDV
jgi:PAS domain S-box-containing protein